MSDADKSIPANSKVPVALDQLPLDELIIYGKELGLHLESSMPQGELLRRIRERQALLAELDRDALLDVVVWARRPVRQSAGKEELAREIAVIRRVDVRGLSYRGLYVLVRLRGIAASGKEPPEVLTERLRLSEPFWDRVARHRRQFIGGLIHKFLEPPPEQMAAEKEDYRFLPEDSSVSIKDRIVDEGVVGGIARRIRGVADDYVREKLDEIENRIDRKLDEIDRRLEEWRDREIANRLKIIRITLVASILVALLSLGYSLLKGH